MAVRRGRVRDGYGGRMSERNQRVDGGAPTPVIDADRHEGAA